MKRLRLPVVEAVPIEAPTAEVLRRSLGGRLEAALPPDIGRCVGLADQPDRPVVILFADAAEAHVWVGQGRVRRVQRGALLTFHGPIPTEIAAVARDIEQFAALNEDDPIAFLGSAPGGSVARGVLVEKCRFGALVLRDDGALLGVGFRRLWRDDTKAN